MQSIVLCERGGQARILPGFGFNCIDLVFRDGLETVPALWAPEGFEAGTVPGYLGGLPILFPYPGRIRDGAFRFGGHAYRLPAIDGLGNALHGQVVSRAWQITARTPGRVEARFRASECLQWTCGGETWPADYEVRVAYEIRPASLTCHFSVRNVDPAARLPCGLGLHPYLSIPVEGQAPGACTVTVPAGSVWELDERMIPTGRAAPVRGESDLRRGRAFASLDLDHVFGDLAFREGACTVTVRDERAGRSLWMRFSDLFRHCVVFTPPQRRAICVEPYSCLPDPFGLEARGVDSGLKVLGPGESFQGWVALGIGTGNGYGAGT